MKTIINKVLFAVTSIAIASHCQAQSKIMYVVHPNSASLTCYSIDADTGDLVNISKNTVITPNFSSGDIMEKNGYIYMTNNLAPQIVQYQIESDGHLDRVNPYSATGIGAWGFTTNGQFAYISNMYSNSVSRYRINAQTGYMQELGSTGLSSALLEPSGAVINSNHPEYFYQAGYASSNIELFLINNDGSLTTTDKIFKTGNQPRGVSFDSSNHAYVMNYLDGTISQYNVNESNGELRSMPQPTVKTGGAPISFTFGSTESYVYIASLSENAIYMYSKTSDGQLIPQYPAKITTSYLSGPRAFYVDESKKLIYISNVNSNTIVRFNIQDNGVLNEASAKVYYLPISGPSLIQVIKLQN